MAKAVLQDQYVAARVYFGAVVALVAFDGLWRLLQLLFSKHRGNFEMSPCSIIYSH